MNGTDGNDSLVGTPGADTLDGLGGDDTVDGLGGDDEVFGGAGNDSVLGGDGDDLMRGDAPAPGALPDDGNDTLEGGAGNDTIGGQGGDDHIDGGADDDRLFGSDGNDRVSGGDGDDFVNGNDGDDTVAGGAGNDTLDGGAGLDVAVIADNGGDPFDPALFDFSGLTVTDGVISGAVDGPDGTDTLAGVEVIKIADTGSDIFVVLAGTDIQTAIDAAAAGDTVVVLPGTFDETILINKSITLISTEGAAGTTISGDDTSARLGTIQIAPGVDGVTIGDLGQGFTIEGINGNGAIEKAAVYVQGDNDGLTLRGNELVAQGDSAFTSEFARALTNALIDGNVFSGQTFVGAQPEGIGFSTQFILGNNVPRQLVVIGEGGSGPFKSGNVTFKNNVVSGTAGGISSDDNASEQGNTLVTIDVDGATISDNTFTGETAGFATGLRARGPDTDIENNTFDNTSGGDTRGVFVDDQGTPGAYAGNVFLGGADPDLFAGTPGDDRLVGGAGDDTLDGGAGLDVAVIADNGGDPFDPALFDFSGLTVTDGVISGAVDGPDGTDTLAGIEVIEVANNGSSTFIVPAGASIQAAIDAAAAGDTVALLAGPFTGSVTIDKQITLSGIGATPSILADGITVAADGTTDAPVLIENLTVENGAGAGIALGDSDNVTIRGVSVQNVTGNGIDIAHADLSTGIAIEAVTIDAADGRAGLRISVDASVDGLAVTESVFNGGAFGIAINNTGGGVDNVVNAQFDKLTFNGQHPGPTPPPGGSRAIFVEKLSDATFSDITINAPADGPFDDLRAFQLNLKGNAFQNIVVDGMEILGFDTAQNDAAAGTFNPLFLLSLKDENAPDGEDASLDGLTIRDVVAAKSATATGNGAIVLDLFTEALLPDVRDVILEGSTLTGEVRLQALGYTSINGNTINGDLLLNNVDAPETGASLAGNTVTGTIRVVENRADATLVDGADDLDLGLRDGGDPTEEGFPADDLDGTGNDRPNRIDGNGGDNALAGEGGADTLAGGGGGDTLTGGAGDDSLDGGAGTDVAVIADNGGAPFDPADFDFTGLSVSGGIVSGALLGPDGTDTLDGIEVLEVANTGSSTFIVLNGQSIQTAIDQASDGDVIEVLVGTFPEDLVVDKTLEIRTAESAIIAGEIDFRAGSEGSVLEGFTIDIDDAGTGVDARVSGLTIRNNAFEGADVVGSRGVVTSGPIGTITIADNTFSGFTTGVFNNPGAASVITGNTFDGNVVGVANDGPDTADISGNTFANSQNEHIGIGAIDEPTDASAFVGENTFDDSAPAVAIFPLGATAITGTAEADVFNGDVTATTEAQAFDGLGGDDVITGGGGDDSLDGGAGGDTARYAGNQGDYNIGTEQAPDGRLIGFTAVTDNNAVDGDEGADTLESIEILEFADATIDLTLPVQVFDPSDNFLGSFEVIQNAIDFAPVGSTIRVAAGTFPEAVDVDKVVIILGPNAGTPGVGSRGAEAVIEGPVTVSADGGATLDGLAFDVSPISGGQAAVSLEGEDATVTNSVFTDAVADGSVGNAIAITGERARVSSNLVDRSGLPNSGSIGNAAIFANGVDEVLITDNTLEFGIIGIVTGDGTGSTPSITVTNNTITAPDPNTDSIFITGPGFGALPNTFDPLPNTIDTSGNVFNTSDGLQLRGTTLADDFTDFATPQNDLFLGNDGDDTLIGGPGDDTLTGNDGEDTLEGGPGDDVLNEGPASTVGSDSLLGDAGDDNISGTLLDDTIAGLAGSDTIAASAGNDTIAGGGGDDVLLGNGGADSVDGGAGDDELLGGGDGDNLEGGAGDDTLSGNRGIDTLTGDDGVDTFEDSPEKFDGDTITDYEDGEEIVFLGVNFTIDEVSGSTNGDLVLEIDTDADGTVDTTLTLAGRSDDLEDLVVLERGPDTVLFFPDVKGVPDIIVRGGEISGDSGIDLPRLSETLKTVIAAGGIPVSAFDFTAIPGSVTLEGFEVPGPGDEPVATLSLVIEGSGLGFTNPDEAGNFQPHKSRLTGIVERIVFDGKLSGEAGEPIALVDNNGKGPIHERPVFTHAFAGSFQGIEIADFEALTLSRFISTLNFGLTDSTIIGASSREVEAVGSAFADVLVGTESSDFLRGNGGDDVLAGAEARDVLAAGAGDDTVFGGKGDDTVFAAAGHDFVAGGAGNDSLLGQGGADTLKGDRGEDTLLGFAGDDVMDGGAGADSLSGSAGADILFGGTGADTLLGQAHDDTLAGGDGNDLLDGGDGDDLAGGGAGADRLFGGTGLDSLAGGFGADTVEGGAGDDLLSGDLGHLPRFPVPKATVLDEGTKDEKTIVGFDPADFLFLGLPAADVLSDANPNDPVLLEAHVFADLALPKGTDPARFEGPDGFDLFPEEDGINVLSYLGIGDAPFEQADPDALPDPSLEDFVALEGPEDVAALLLSGGNDRIAGGDGNDRIFGNGGSDTLTGEAGADTISGGTGADLINGGAGDDRLVGDVDFSKFLPDDPDAVFEGGAIPPGVPGKDRTPFAGADDFFFADDFGNDVVVDFQPGLDVLYIVGGTFDRSDLRDPQFTADTVFLEVNNGTDEAQITLINIDPARFDVDADLVFL